MKKFTITATLRTPLIRGGYMTLDALLMAELGRGDVSDLIRCEEGLYFASAAILIDEAKGEQASFVASMRPETTPEWLNVIAPNYKKNTVLAIGNSRQREAGNVLNSYKVVAASSVVWCATGHKEAVFDALKSVRFVGKRRSSGYGEVSKWECGDEDIDGVVGYSGEPLRPIPVDRWNGGGDQVAIDTAWKPPYWDVSNRAKCYAPEMP